MGCYPYSRKNNSPPRDMFTIPLCPYHPTTVGACLPSSFMMGSHGVSDPSCLGVRDLVIARPIQRGSIGVLTCRSGTFQRGRSIAAPVATAARKASKLGMGCRPATHACVLSLCFRHRVNKSDLHAKFVVAVHLCLSRAICIRQRLKKYA